MAHPIPWQELRLSRFLYHQEVHPSQDTRLCALCPSLSIHRTASCPFLFLDLHPFPDHPAQLRPLPKHLRHLITHKVSHAFLRGGQSFYDVLAPYVDPEYRYVLQDRAIPLPPGVIQVPPRPYWEPMSEEERRKAVAMPHFNSRGEIIARMKSPHDVPAPTWPTRSLVDFPAAVSTKALRRPQEESERTGASQRLEPVAQEPIRIDAPSVSAEALKHLQEEPEQTGASQIMEPVAQEPTRIDALPAGSPPIQPPDLLTPTPTRPDGPSPRKKRRTTVRVCASAECDLPIPGGFRGSLCPECGFARWRTQFRTKFAGVRAQLAAEPADIAHAAAQLPAEVEGDGDHEPQVKVEESVESEGFSIEPRKAKRPAVVPKRVIVEIPTTGAAHLDKDDGSESDGLPLAAVIVAKRKKSPPKTSTAEKENHGRQEYSDSEMDVPLSSMLSSQSGRLSEPEEEEVPVAELLPSTLQNAPVPLFPPRVSVAAPAGCVSMPSTPADSPRSAVSPAGPVRLRIVVPPLSRCSPKKPTHPPPLPQELDLTEPEPESESESEGELGTEESHSPLDPGGAATTPLLEQSPEREDPVLRLAPVLELSPSLVSAPQVRVRCPAAPTPVKPFSNIRRVRLILGPKPPAREPTSSSSRDSSTERLPSPSPSRRVRPLGKLSLDWDSDLSDLTPLEDSGESEIESDAEDDEEDVPLFTGLLARSQLASTASTESSAVATANPQNEKHRWQCAFSACANLLPPGWKFRQCPKCRYTARQERLHLARGGVDAKRGPRCEQRREEQEFEPPADGDYSGWRKCTKSRCSKMVPGEEQYKWRLCPRCRRHMRESNSRRARLIREEKWKATQVDWTAMRAAAEQADRDTRAESASSDVSSRTAVTAGKEGGLTAFVDEPQYQHFAALLLALRGRFDTFCAAQTRYLLCTARPPPRQMMFAFTGEYSVVADPGGGAVDAVVDVVVRNVHAALGLAFSMAGVRPGPEDSIVATFSCTYTARIPPPTTSAPPPTPTRAESAPSPGASADTAVKDGDSTPPGGEPTVRGGDWASQGDEPTADDHAPALVPEGSAKNEKDAPLAVTMKGELQVGVAWDRRHRWFPGQRIIVCFRLVG
ncbi:uncharacterized protein BXZ73DRAFT_99862 [Epithele typhae]|uniref:uncharacterized protein n=1 Tax=Epithele typhae TaxID=378194 RepID=UPI00200852CD|nr:uncharacterized protein BXZ73DRAFT_99862 [Epithele typhae]KAH9938801.1 hypothetical protein BXZ73DRAFT_99862 [Epithele typhae]